MIFSRNTFRNYTPSQPFQYCCLLRNANNVLYKNKYTDLVRLCDLCRTLVAGSDDTSWGATSGQEHTHEYVKPSIQRDLNNIM